MSGRSIDGWIDAWAQHRPGHPALVSEESTVSYADLAERVARRRAWLAGQGVEAGDHVGFCGLNRIEFIESLAACARLGAVLLPLNNRLTAGEIRFQLADAEPVLVLATDGFAATIEDADPAVTVIDLDLDQDLDLDRRPGPGAAADGLISTGLPADPDRPVLMVYTS
ncbi:MAG: class I adenylate-forming enzyme family protein, partial [Actinomycetota bacterium]